MVTRPTMTLHFLNPDPFALVSCPAGTMSREGTCTVCPQGTYQDQEGRDFCHKCPRGSSLAGAASVDQCELTEVLLCQFHILKSKSVCLNSSLGVFTYFRCNRLSEAGTTLFRKWCFPPSTTWLPVWKVEMCQQRGRGAWLDQQWQSSYWWWVLR